MSDEQLELTRRKILGGAAVVGIAGAGAGLGTSALYSDTESFTNNLITAGTTNLTVQANIVARSAAVDDDPSSPPGVSIQETVVDGSPGTGLTFTDLKPGDEFVLGVDVVVEDNPMYVQLQAKNADDSEGTDTEPEPQPGADDDTDAVGDGSGDDAGDLDNKTLVTIGHDASDGTANDFTWDTGGLAEPSDPEFGSAGGISLTSFVANLQDGILYEDSGGVPLGHGSDTPAEIGGGDNVTHWLYVRVPTSVGNQIQGDTVSFDLVWNAEQVRNNDNPFASRGATFPLTKRAKLAAQDPAADSEDNFGFSVSLDGDTALIGAVDDEDPNGTRAGSAYVFTRSGGSWSQQQKLTASDGDPDDAFGRSVSLDGDTALIGAEGDEGPTGRGSAYVFTRSGSSWNQQQKLTASDGDPGDAFGFSVSLDGDTALIGAAEDEDPNGFRAGSAYVFTRSGGSWSQQQKLTANDGDSRDVFGESVALDGDTALIGAVFDEDPSGNGNGGGSAYVFTRSGSSWSQQHKLAANDGDGRDAFGRSVSLDGDTALIGANFDEDPNGRGAGSAYVFTRSGSSWSQQQKLAANDGDSNDSFGFSVSLDGDTALIGADSDDDPNGFLAGAAYVFTRSGSSWSQRQKLAANNGDSNDSFGRSVSLDGDTALIGAPKDEDPNGSFAGSVCVFGP